MFVGRDIVGAVTILQHAAVAQFESAFRLLQKRKFDTNMELFKGGKMQ